MITLRDTDGFEFYVTVTRGDDGQPSVDFQAKDASLNDCSGVRLAANFMGAAQQFCLNGNWSDSPICKFGPDQTARLKREIFEVTRKDGRFVTVWVDDCGVPF